MTRICLRFVLIVISSSIGRFIMRQLWCNVYGTSHNIKYQYHLLIFRTWLPFFNTAVLFLFLFSFPYPQKRFIYWRESFS